MVERVRIGDVLQLDRKPVQPDPSLEYVSIGIRSFGKGIFHYEPKLGSQLGRLRFFEVQPDRLIVSNIKGWEGAIAVSSETDRGCLASNRFLSYASIDNRIDVNWARWYFLSELGLEQIQRASPGSADRNRTLAIDRFEALEIPLPGIEQQRSMAEHLDQMRAISNQLSERHVTASKLAGALADSAASEVLMRGMSSGWPLMPLTDIAEVNPKPDPLPHDEEVTFVPMAAVNADTGTITTHERRVNADVGGGHKQFRRGDIIFARITPSMQNGKSAIFQGNTNYGYGSTEFHIIRPGLMVRPEWIHQVVRTRDFRNKAAERFTGTAGQQRVPAKFLHEVRVPVPPLEVQESACAELALILDLSLTLRKVQRRSKELRSALEPAVLNRAFAGLS